GGRSAAVGRRGEKEGLLPSEGAGGAESNVKFLLPREVVRRSWLKCVTEANAPEPLYRRFRHQIENTYPNRFKPGALLKVERSDVANGLKILARILWRVGVLADYRHIFWRMAIPALKRGDVESVIHAGLVGHHLIRSARVCGEGVGESSFYGGAGPRSARLAGAPAALLLDGAEL